MLWKKGVSWVSNCPKLTMIPCSSIWQDILRDSELQKLFPMDSVEVPPKQFVLNVDTDEKRF